MASSHSGLPVGVASRSDTIDSIHVPVGYVSNTPLNASATWAGKTITELGLIPGSYVFTWGSGATADTLTLNIAGVAPPPPPAPTPATYEYTGQNFTTVTLGTYTTDMRVTGTITTSTPIPPNSTNFDIRTIATNWSFFDGVQTLTNNNGAFHAATAFSPKFTTDAAGNITTADIFVTDDPTATVVNQTNRYIASVQSAGFDHGVALAKCTGVTDGICTAYLFGPKGVVNNSPGTWTLSTPPPTAHVATADYAETADHAELVGITEEVEHAISADSAASADHAITANTALEVDRATTADTADTLSTSLCSDNKILRKENGTWNCTDTAPHAESVTYANSVGQAAVTARAESLNDSLCVNGEQLLKQGGGWVCTTTASRALSARSALQANSLSETLCSDEEILIKENGLWVCGAFKLVDEAKIADETAHATEADHALIADTLGTDTCGAQGFLLKINNEWQCSSAAAGTPFFSQGIALRIRDSASGDIPMLSTPNDSDSCCFPESESQAHGQLLLPRDGILSSLLVKPVSMPSPNTLLAVEILVNGTPRLTVQHDRNLSGSDAVSNVTEYYSAQVGDRISIRFTEKSGACLSAGESLRELGFLQASTGSLEDVVLNILPLLIPYDPEKDPIEWNHTGFKNQLADDLRDDFNYLEDEQNIDSVFLSCGRYNVSFMLD